MADINLSFPVGWTDVYAAAGVSVGTRLIIQNKDPLFDPLMREQADSPAAGDHAGAIAPYGRQYNVPDGAPGCWVRGRLSGATGGPGIFINVQVPT